MTALALERLCCPRCRSALAAATDTAMSVRCADETCPYHAAGFPVVDGQPVLIDFAASIFDRGWFEERGGGSYIARDATGSTLAMRVRRLAEGRNRAARDNARLMLAHLHAHPRERRARILVVGGGALGDGHADLLADPAVEVVGTDVYPSRFTQVIADGHRLPFPDGSFDAVWIQAVLEHVLDPGEVAAEIGRVLGPGGLVYADTPFMQQVHEGAYDFTRFTLSGHRWLFRHFTEIRSGVVGGPGTALWWSLRYLVRALTGSDRVARLLSLPFFPLRFLDRAAQHGLDADAACGVFFLGIKEGTAVAPRDMPAFYARSRGQASTTAARPATAA